MAVWVALLLSSCGDPGFEVFFVNPCDQQVEFIYSNVAPGETEVVASQVVAVRGGERERLVGLSIDLSGREVLVTVDGFDGYAERWAEPGRGESREFTFDEGMCDRISE